MPGPVLLYGAGHSFFTVILGCLRPVRRFPRANGRRAQRKGATAENTFKDSFHFLFFRHVYILTIIFGFVHIFIGIFQKNKL